MYAITVEMPDSQSSPDASWRLAEWVRLLQASVVVESALRRGGGSAFVYVPYSVYEMDTPGPKYTRVIRSTENQRFVVAFMENATGKIVKSAGWASPAKDRDGLAYRYDLLDDDSRADLYSQGTNATFYKR